MYPKFLDIGYTPHLFWDLTIGEIIDLLESENRKIELKSKERELELKTKVIINSLLARQIGEHVASLFSKEVKISSPQELLPELFKDDIEEEQNNNELDLYKAKMEEFAFRHNFKIDKGGG